MTKDNAGNLPKEGDYVAYNWSGQIATGYIKRIRRGSRYGHWTTIYHIECVLPKFREGKESVVRGGAQCLLVLSSG